MEEHKQTENHLIGCSYCENKIPFELPQSIQRMSQKDKSILNAVYRWAKKEAKKYKVGMVVQHTPFLMGASIEETSHDCVAR